MNTFQWTEYLLYYFFIIKGEIRFAFYCLHYTDLQRYTEMLDQDMQQGALVIWHILIMWVILKEQAYVEVQLSILESLVWSILCYCDSTRS